jgi:hypothetical protein
MHICYAVKFGKPKSSIVFAACPRVGGWCRQVLCAALLSPAVTYVAVTYVLLPLQELL